MNVLLLATGFPPLVGGIERYAANLARGLRAAGCTVTVVTTVDSRLNWKLVKLLPLCWGAVRACWRTRPDRVVAMVWTHEGVVALLLRMLFGVDYAVIAHGGEILQYARRPLHGRALRAVMRRARVVIANSRYTAELLAGGDVPSHRIVVSHPPVAITDGPRSREIDDRFGLHGRLVLLTAARLVPRKGHALVVDALARLAPTHPSLVYVITGAGAYLESLRSRAARLGVADRLIEAGRVSDHDLAGLYRRADVYVSPTIEAHGDVEGFGISLAEAGAYGLPVVAGRSGGVEDVVADGETGCLVPPGDVDALTATLARLLNDPHARETLGARARARVFEHFHADRQAERVARCLTAHDLDRRFAVAGSR